MNVDYVLMNPSNNITVLVTSFVAKKYYKIVANLLLKTEKTAEQVGFLSYDNCKLFLEMAGGEFCGNATMSAAVLFSMINKIKNGTVSVNIKNTANVFDVKVKHLKNNEYQSIISMPREKTVAKITYKDKEYYVVQFEDIAHIVLKNVSPNKYFEKYVKQMCLKLKQKALGLIFFDEANMKIKPLVYVKSINSLYWENSCASGTMAVAISLKNKKNLKVKILQPSGSVLKVEVKDDSIRLEGTAKKIYEKNILVDIDKLHV